MENHELITLKLAYSIDDLSQTKWNKLMFFIDSAAICLNDQQLTNFTYIKMPYGPVPENYRSIINEMKAKNIINVSTNLDISDAVRIIKPAMDLTYIDQVNQMLDTLDKEFTIIDRIINSFKNWSAVELSNFSHMLNSWIEPNLYQKINLDSMKDDQYLKQNFQLGNFGKILLS
ncbi:Panacea domain-containing protein [Leptospira levettii]|uniref:Panacea domain-containing protein n=1 Tax=Leptospira levettii TaxID=2023178 RepID=UPI000C29D029|nr:Panacea domain-containing protein [Leptospira levettii]PKA22713.1 hypothetical protein CH381_29450 [Leptospira sp. mixed culture ATI2-C-A1]TGM23500.1 DUF4065 domain-containing protein [Leptospira levettii]